MKPLGKVLIGISIFFAFVIIQGWIIILPHTPTYIEVKIEVELLIIGTVSALCSIGQLK